MSLEQYWFTNPSLLPKPTDIPDDFIAYNPSAIWTTEDRYGKTHDILYARVEPDRSCPTSSHLGKSRVWPYIIDVSDYSKPLVPYGDAEEKMGEDPALTRINRRLGNGAIERIWLLSCVDARPFPDKPDHVKTLRTRFYTGTKLDSLEYVAEGPEWMKDIRIIQDGSDPTKLHIYGRPKPVEYSGNITHTTVAGIDMLDEQVISDAPYIDENLFPVGSGVWGGVGDVIDLGAGKHILIAHRAHGTNSNDNGLHYEAVLYQHNTQTKRIADLGILAAANMFPSGTIKANDAVDLHDVVFPGGGYNGTLNHVTFGVRDGSIGIGGVQKK